MSVDYSLLDIQESTNHIKKRREREGKITALQETFIYTFK